MTETTGDIGEIQGFNETQRELLEAAGIENLLSLADSEADLLLQEMERANSMLELTTDLPTVSEIQSWIDQSRKILDYYPEIEVHRLEPVEDPEAGTESEVLYAIPIPVQHMVKQKIAVDQIPAMESFVDDDYVREKAESREDTVEDHPEISRMTELPPVQNAPKVAGPQVMHIEAKARTAVEVDRTPFEQREGTPVEPLVSKISDIRKAPSTGLNAGKTPHSRGYIRGVLHPQPIRIRIAAIITIMTLILLPTSLVAGTMVILEYPIWIVGFPIGLLVIGLLYFMIARGMRCRICGQPIYAPKACRRHVKAHHVRLLGYIFPTCFHVLFFGWFRCIYCGTSVRVKE